jgi:deuterolysin
LISLVSIDYSHNQSNSLETASDSIMKFTSAVLALAVATTSATTLESDCSSSQRTAVTNANQACASMASAAADAAESGSADTFESFFKDTSQATRQAVASSFRKVAEECSSTPGGTGTSYCTDQRGNCGGDLLAYTYWQNQGADVHVGSTYYCPRYYSVIPATGNRCDDQSQASNTLHETTHAVLATSDIAYGLSNVKALSSSQALQNADSYTYYAIGTYSHRETLIEEKQLTCEV